MEKAATGQAEGDSVRLEDQLCFALYAASRAVTAGYRPLLDELGLTYPQYLVMLALWERDSLSVRDLGAALQLESSTLSPLLRRLEVNGLVLRERRVDDERSVAVRLTEAGANLRGKARTVPLAIGDAMNLTPEQNATARYLLRLVTANVTRR
ncbi:MarR family transcriptional regulator [Streptomyces sp. NBC_01443]|uniref:MarR family winged helix-turn-helix transcriptional regulator n=1 Tax=Streptomyces sp. NBC_01443 TaxID=2903868 RepID=UPI0022552CF5|nr:MarR family transcriptional regulator [Streptomyces sp. NBC_01443]MCX4632314.1 MarR family transcriptional regulator [Streptomyces sp. NBC_01443]